VPDGLKSGLPIKGTLKYTVYFSYLYQCYYYTNYANRCNRPLRRCERRVKLETKNHAPGTDSSRANLAAFVPNGKRPAPQANFSLRGPAEVAAALSRMEEAIR
jgi:hypothetical protein